MKNRLTGRT